MHTFILCINTCSDVGKKKSNGILSSPLCFSALQHWRYTVKPFNLLFTENHSAPPDVTTYTSEHSIQVERPQGSTARVAPKYGNAELMETGDGMSQSKTSFFLSIVIFSVVTVCICSWFLLGTFHLQTSTKLQHLYSLKINWCK